MDNEEPVNSVKWDCVQLKLVGRVQGVGFRAFVVDMACRMALDGWVCNRADGSVDILVSGPAFKVDEFVRVCVHETPTRVRIDHLDLRHASLPDKAGFTCRPTY